MFCTRRDRDETVYFFYVRDETETWLRISGETEMRPNVSVSFSTRLRREPSFNEENDWILALLYLKTTNPDQDETETRLSKIEANETRPRRDCLKIFHPRRDRDETTSKIVYETESLGTFSLETETRPRLSPISETVQDKNLNLLPYRNLNLFCWMNEN